MDYDRQNWIRARHKIAKLIFRLRLRIARRPPLAWLPSRRTAARFLSGDLLLVTIAFNRPELIELQIRMIRKWVVEPFDLIVADNSSRRRARRQIKAVCRKNGILYVSLPKNPYSGRDASFSHAEALNYWCRNYGDKLSAEIVGFLDHDIFPSEHVAIRSRMTAPVKYYGRLMRNADIWYIWPGFMFMKSDGIALSLLDFAPIRGVADTGGSNFSICLESLGPGEFSECSSTEVTVDIEGSTYGFELHDGWIHRGNGSDWRKTGGGKEAIQDLTTLLAKFGLPSAESAPRYD